MAMVTRSLLHNGLTCTRPSPMQQVSTCSSMARGQLQRRVAMQNLTCSATRPEEDGCSTSTPLHPAALRTGILMPAASQLATVSPARADDSVAAAGDAAASAAGAAADTAVAPAPSGGFLINFTNALPDDPVITVLFYTAITILSVVTLGVAYLAITSWLDERAEKEDRKKFDAAAMARAITKDREKAASRKGPVRRKSAATSKTGGGKGFS